MKVDMGACAITIGMCAAIAFTCANSAQSAETDAQRLESAVTMNSIHAALGLAHKDRVCRQGVRTDESARVDYFNCMMNSAGDGICAASAEDLSHLLAFISARKDLKSRFEDVDVTASLKLRCGSADIGLEQRHTHSAKRAISGECSYRMPVLIAYTITATRKPSRNMRRYAYCSSAVGRKFLDDNCFYLYRRIAMRGDWPREWPIPKVFGVESLLCQAI
jgi:hypothetical protein